jgi:hypothetical protein
MAPISKASPVIRPMNPLEVAWALDWAHAEGWNPGLHDAIPFHLDVIKVTPTRWSQAAFR